jgi:hypothetical protein
VRVFEFANIFNANFALNMLNFEFNLKQIVTRFYKTCTVESRLSNLNGTDR